MPTAMTQSALEAPAMQAPIARTRAVAAPRPVVAKTPAFGLLIAICIADLIVLAGLMAMGFMQGTL